MTQAAQNPWAESDRCDPEARKFADRHYNRQSIGAKNFAPPGRTLVLKHPSAFWISSWPFAEYVLHAWGGAWVCTAFRLEDGSPGEASALVRYAVAITHWKWASPPSVPAWHLRRKHDRTDVKRTDICMITFVNTEKTRAKRDPGRCFRRAGFVEVGRTKSGLVALGLPTSDLPTAQPPRVLTTREREQARMSRWLDKNTK